MTIEQGMILVIGMYAGAMVGLLALIIGEAIDERYLKED